MLLLAAGLAAVLASGVLRHISFESLSTHHHELTAFAASHPARSLALFAAVDIAITALWLPGSGGMTVAAGFLFGPWLGGLTALLSASAGSTVFFLVARGAAGDLLARRFGPRVAALEARIRDEAFPYLLALRLAPVVPLPLTNLAAALFEAPLRAFLAATLLGMAPASFVFAGLGSALGRLFDAGHTPGSDFFWQPQVALPLGGLMLLALAPAAWGLLHRRRRASA